MEITNLHILILGVTPRIEATHISFNDRVRPLAACRVIEKRTLADFAERPEAAIRAVADLRLTTYFALTARRVPPTHQRITSFARTSNDGGMVMPIALAVLRLITRSNLVACSIGRSSGFAPLIILSTKYAA
jgi:hypothetical protein